MKRDAKEPEPDTVWYVDPLTKLVREYYAAKSRLDSWAPWTNLQIKGAARARAKAKAKREFDAADDALRAAVGVDGLGRLIQSAATTTKRG